MLPLLYLIDTQFSREFFDTYKATAKMFMDCHVVTTPDVHMGTTTQIEWSQCVDHVVNECRSKGSALVLVIGHKGIFRRHLQPLDRFKFEVRVPPAEAELREKLGNPAVTVYVSGFHHEPGSQISRFLSNREALTCPGAFNRLRAIVEEGGGPLGQISVLKHELMRPFTSVRLQLQIDAENGGQGMDERLSARIAMGIEQGRTQLDQVASRYESRTLFNVAVRNARALFEQDVNEIASDAAAFNGWIDKLNDALDQLRQEAR